MAGTALAQVQRDRPAAQQRQRALLRRLPDRLQHRPGRSNARRRRRHQPAELHVPARPGRPGPDAAEPLDPHPSRQPPGLPAGRGACGGPRQRDAAGVQRRGHHPRSASARDRAGGRAQLRRGRLRRAFDAGQGARLERFGHVQHGPHPGADAVRRPRSADRRADRAGDAAARRDALIRRAGSRLRRSTRALRRADDQGLQRGRRDPRRAAAVAVPLVGDPGLHRAGCRRDGGRRALQLLRPAGRADRQRGRQPRRRAASRLRGALGVGRGVAGCAACPTSPATRHCASV